ncbi:glycosyltransferase family 4 protein [soil metagenome]
MKKRVLQFIGSFHQGGSERQAVALTKMLKDDGSFDVFAATLNNEGVLRSDIETFGLPEIPEFPLTSFFNPNFVRQVRGCAKYLRDNKIDVVHTHDFYTNVFGMAAASLAGVPVRIASKRETGGMRSAAQKFVENIAFGRASAIVANAEAVREHLIARGIASDKIAVIHNGIDISRFDVPVDRAVVFDRYGLPVDSRIVTLVANLRHSVKNVPMFIRTAKRVTETLPDVHFVVAGEGELRPELEGIAVRLGVAANMHFIGRCDDVPALLGSSFACMLTSDAEGFSNSILEYMAARRPVVATNVGGAAEAVTPKVTGYLVQRDDDNWAAMHLTDLLRNPSMASEFGEAGRKVIEQQFSQTAQLTKTLELYHGLLGRH